MNLKQLLADDDAVSPVIGVILMVAITVILAAVIGTFVLGLGNQVKTSAPSANFDTDFTDDASANSTKYDNLTITHTGGDSIVAQSINLTATTDFNFVDNEGDAITDSNSDVNASKSFDLMITELGPKDKVGAGDQVIVANPRSIDESDGVATGQLNGETFRIVWSPTDSDKSNVLRTIDFPS